MGVGGVGLLTPESFDATIVTPLLSITETVAKEWHRPQVDQTEHRRQGRTIEH